jgi:class 3 adenylate cyclase/tetratricopeptide (TPR) repeat protein
MTDLQCWLDSIRLGKYADAFVENDIGLDVLPELSESDLKDLGLSMGDRKRFLKAVAAPEGVPAPSPSPPADAERRQLTVMFCDLVGSTALSEKLDPEDLREVIHAYQECCAGVIARFGGIIARYMGDGLLIYFGYPQAHEEDAERAIRAGLGIVEEMGELRPRDVLTLQVRIGIATGLVVAGDVIGEGASEESAVLGETPNLAARLQSLAEPNTILIAPATHHLVSGLFEHKDLGRHDLKGISTPVQAWQVVGETLAESRFDAAHAAGMTPLVGREEEIGLLLNRWDQAKDGEGQVILLSGEAGVGKSRIVRSLRERLEKEARNRVLYYCSPFHQNTAFYPAIDQLERGLCFEKDDDPAEKLDKLEAVLDELGLSVPEIAPPLVSLLSLQASDRYPAPPFGGDELKKRIFEALVTMLEAMASQAPVLMVVEDLHWIDPTTLELLNLLIEHLRSARIVILLTYRPEFDPPWGDHAHVTGLALNRLSRKESAAMISKVAGAKAMPKEVFNEIIAKTDGVPLFVEELTKTVLESDLLEETEDRYVLSMPLQPLAIPTSLQDSLMARLDRLASVKEVAQLAATLGRTFSHELLAAVSPLEEGVLDDAISQLLVAGLIYRHGLQPDVTYEFKHALVQDVAYQSLLKGSRLHFHQQILQTLEERFPETTEAEPEMLAHHAFQGEMWEQAVHYFRQSGSKAARRSAHREAVAGFEHALKALAHLPESRKGAELGIDLRLDLRNSLYPLGEHEAYFDHLRQAETLAAELDDPRRLGWVLAYLITYHWIHGDHQDALEAGHRAVTIVPRAEDLALHVQTSLRLGWVYHVLGDHPRAIKFLEESLAPLTGDSIREFFGMPAIASVMIRSYIALSLAEMGEFKEGIACGEESLQVAELVEHPQSLVAACTSLGGAYLYQGNLARAIPLLERAYDLAEGRSVLVWVPRVAGHLGYAYALSGRPQEATPLLERALSEQASGGGEKEVLWLSWLSQTCLLGSEAKRATEYAKRGLALARERKERGHEAWIQWVLGEIAAHPDPPDVKSAEDHYRQALAMATELGMRPLVAHCHLGLGTLFRRIGKRKQAQEHLATTIDMYHEMKIGHWMEQAEEERGRLN